MILDFLFRIVLWPREERLKCRWQNQKKLYMHNFFSAKAGYNFWEGIYPVKKIALIIIYFCLLPVSLAAASQTLFVCLPALLQLTWQTKKRIKPLLPYSVIRLPYDLMSSFPLAWKRVRQSSRTTIILPPRLPLSFDKSKSSWTLGKPCLKRTSTLSEVRISGLWRLYTQMTRASLESPLSSG